MFQLFVVYCRAVGVCLFPLGEAEEDEAGLRFCLPSWPGHGPIVWGLYWGRKLPRSLAPKTFRGLGGHRLGPLGWRVQEPRVQEPNGFSLLWRPDFVLAVWFSFELYSRAVGCKGIKLKRAVDEFRHIAFEVRTGL